MNGFSAGDAGFLFEPFFDHESGIALILAVQNMGSPAMTAAMKIITGFVLQAACMGLPLLYWLWDEKKTFRLGILLIFSFWLNDLAKSFFKMPRPFVLQPSLALIHESVYGFPSGHAQLSLTLLVPLAYWFTRCLNRRLEAEPARLARVRILFWMVTALVILLTGFSRLYLGVHFLHDLAGGWLLGSIVLMCFFALQSRTFAESVPGKRMAGFFSPDGDWASRFGKIRPLLAASALVSVVMIMPGLRNILCGGAFFGFSAGYIIAKRKLFLFPSRKEEVRTESIKKRALRAVLQLFTGFAGIAALFFVDYAFYAGPGAIYIDPGMIFDFILYAALAFWISAGAPWVFRRFLSRKNAAQVPRSGP